MLLQPEPSHGDSQAPPAGPPIAPSYRTASGPTGATWGLLAAAGPPHLQGRLATPWCCRGDPSAPEPVLGLHLPLERENFTQWGPPGCSVTGMCSCLSSCFPGEAQAQRGPAGHPLGQPRASGARARPPAQRTWLRRNGRVGLLLTRQVPMARGRRGARFSVGGGDRRDGVGRVCPSRGERQLASLPRPAHRPEPCQDAGPSSGGGGGWETSLWRARCCLNRTGFRWPGGGGVGAAGGWPWLHV